MNRLAAAAALLLVPIAAQAFDARKPETIRIAVMKSVAVSGERYGTPVRSIPGHLRDELRRAGFDAFTIDATLGELEGRADRDADFYIEVEATDRYSDTYGGIDVYGRHAGVNIGVVSTNIEARINVYDGATLELYAQFDLDKSNTVVAPTNIGVGGRGAGIWLGISLPVSYLQHRSVARKVARTAAIKVAEAVRTP